MSAPKYSELIKATLAKAGKGGMSIPALKKEIGSTAGFSEVPFKGALRLMTMGGILKKVKQSYVINKEKAAAKAKLEKVKAKKAAAKAKAASKPKAAKKAAKKATKPAAKKAPKAKAAAKKPAAKKAPKAKKAAAPATTA